MYQLNQNQNIITQRLLDAENYINAHKFNGVRYIPDYDLVRIRAEFAEGRYPLNYHSAIGSLPPPLKVNTGTGIKATHSGDVNKYEILDFKDVLNYSQNTFIHINILSNIFEEVLKKKESGPFVHDREQFEEIKVICNKSLLSNGDISEIRDSLTKLISEESLSNKITELEEEFLTLLDDKKASLRALKITLESSEEKLASMKEEAGSLLTEVKEKLSERVTETANQMFDLEVEIDSLFCNSVKLIESILTEFLKERGRLVVEYAAKK